MEPLSKIFASSKMLPSKAISQLKADTPNCCSWPKIVLLCWLWPIMAHRETVSDKLDKMQVQTQFSGKACHEIDFA